jgi:hypothetical protein
MPSSTAEVTNQGLKGKIQLAAQCCDNSARDESFHDLCPPGTGIGIVESHGQPDGIKDACLQILPEE